MSAITTAPTDLVVLDGQQPMTTSKAVAAHFGKQHRHVLETIRNLGCSDDFNRSNFRLVDEMDAKGQMRPMYRLTRDGFVILAMGFSGAPAMAWKERFLAAFNAMERELLARGKDEQHRTELDLLRTQRRLIQAQRALLAAHRRELRNLRPLHRPEAPAASQMTLPL